MLFQDIMRKSEDNLFSKPLQWFVPIIVLTAAFAILAGMPGTAMAEKPVTLKIQTAWATTVPILGEPLAVLAEATDKISGGQLKLKIYAPNKLASTLEIFDAVSAGVIDGGWAYPGYWVGKNSALYIFASTPLGPPADAALAWYYKGGGMELWREIYGKHDVYSILGGLGPQEAGGWFNKEINSVDDLKGLKVRWAGLGAVLLQEFEVSTALIPAGEIATSLQKGIIDGAEFGPPSLDKLFGMYKSGAKYYSEL